MRYDADPAKPRGDFRWFLHDEFLLVVLLGAWLALFLSDARLRTAYNLPELRLVLVTLFVLAGGIVALLSATRFSVERQRFDLFLCGGFLTTSIAALVFTIGPAVARTPVTSADTWAAALVSGLGWALLAIAPHARGRAVHHHTEFWVMLGALAVAIGCIAFASRTGGSSPIGPPRIILVVMKAAALTGFALRFRSRGDDLDRFLAFGATLMLFASLDDVFTPLAAAPRATQGDFLRLLGYGVLLVGVWRAIRASEFGQAVAEERARIAREIHDGLAQYLFAVSAHASLLESGADLEETLPQLKEAALSAQREARFAVLALSSAAGDAPFGAALRRYVDFLTVEGAFEVELAIDEAVRLAPDEQIEIFRIVQEGLANARKHAGARRAWVTVGRRGAERLVAVRDDGSGFDPAVAPSAGQGLKNIRERTSTIGGVLSLASVPGRGTALEVVLRA